MPQETRKALLIALSFALLGLVLAFLYIRRYEQELSGGERVAVLTVLKDVSPGETIREAMLAIREIPTAYVDARNVLAKDKDKVVGIDTVIPIRNQQTLQWTDLAVRSDIRNLSSLVSPGKRAVTVSAPRAEATSNKLIRPGDRVDLIATLPASGHDGGHRSLLLLQKILVVAVGLRTDRLSDSDEKAGYRRDDSALTLSLDVEEAQLLSLAQAQGQLSVGVRNPEDALTYGDLPDMDSASIIRVRDDLRARRPSGPSRPNGPIRLGGE